MVLLIVGAFFVSGIVGAIVRRRRPPTPPMHNPPIGDPSIGAHAGFSSQNAG